MKQNTKSCIYVGLYVSGLFNLGPMLSSRPCLHNFWFWRPYIFFVVDSRNTDISDISYKIRWYNHNCVNTFYSIIIVIHRHNYEACSLLKVSLFQWFMNWLSFSFPYKWCLFSISLTASTAIPQEVNSVTVSTARHSNAYSILITVIFLLLLLSVYNSLMEYY